MGVHLVGLCGAELSQWGFQLHVVCPHKLGLLFAVCPSESDWQMDPSVRSDCGCPAVLVTNTSIWLAGMQTQA